MSCIQIALWRKCKWFTRDIGVWGIDTQTLLGIRSMRASASESDNGPLAFEMIESSSLYLVL